MIIVVMNIPCDAKFSEAFIFIGRFFAAEVDFAAATGLEEILCCNSSSMRIKIM